MRHMVDILAVSKRHNITWSIRLPLRSIIFLLVGCLIITLVTMFLFVRNARGAFIKLNISEIERENEFFLGKLDSLRHFLKHAQTDFNEHISQDNRERTFWRMAYIHPDIWSMGIGGKSYEPFSESISDHTRNVLNDIYESVDILKGKCLLRKASLEEIENQMEKNIYLWAHIPSVNPVPGRRIGSGFGYRVDPIDKKTIRMHWGVDIGAPRGTLIYASADGVISDVGWHHGYGLTIEIDHGFGFKTRYAHCKTTLVKKGTYVKRGQVIATVGNTGRSTCPHLHYEVHVSGVKVNPRNYIDFSDIIFD